MKQGSTFFLKGVIFLIGVFSLALCVISLPRGTQSEVMGGYLPISIGRYISAIPFFIALYEALKLLNYIDMNKAFSELSVKSLKNIKHCALAISLFYTAGMPYIYLVAKMDDAPGVIIIVLIIILAGAVVATFAALLQQILQDAIDIKSENELTV